MPLKGGNYWLGPLFLNSQAVNGASSLHRGLRAGSRGFHSQAKPLPLLGQGPEARGREAEVGARGPRPASQFSPSVN